MVVHHPLLLRGVHSVATTTYKGAVVHQLIRAGIALLRRPHQRRRGRRPGVSDALARRLGLRRRPAAGAERAPPGPGGHGWPSRCRWPSSSTSWRRAAAGHRRSACARPATRTGSWRTVAVVGGAGDGFLADVAAAGVDAYLTADLRHHPASEHLAGGGPALLDAAHWATERPWLDALADELRADLDR